MGNKCCHEFGALLTDIDLLGVPVTLTYEGKKTYKTCLGGVCSLITLILIIFVIAGILNQYISNPIITSNFKEEMIQMWENTQSFTINQNQGFMAFRITTTSDNETFKTQVQNNEVVTAQFFIPQRVEGSLYKFDSNYTYTTGLCTDIYAEYVADSADLQAAIEGDWYCADTTDKPIELLNSYWYDNNITLMLQIDSCQAIYGADGYNCVTEQETLDNLSIIQVETKVIGRYFDLNEVDNGNNGLVWHGNKQWTTPLGLGINIQYFYEVTMNRITYQGNPIFDFSSIFSSLNDAITTYSLDQVHYVTYDTSSQTTDAPFYNLIIQQGSKINYFEYSTQTLDTVLAIIGGFIAIIVPIAYFLIGWYQEFNYKRSLLEQSFTFTRKVSRMSSQSGQDAGKQVLDQIQKQIPYRVSLCEWMKSCFCANCCCCTAMGKEADIEYKMYNEGYKRLCKETDMLTMVKEKRVSNFLGDVQLRPGQKQLVSYFEDYYLNDENLQLPGKPTTIKILEDLEEEFSPKDNQMDAMIMKAILGYNYDNKDEEESPANPSSIQ